MATTRTSVANAISTYIKDQVLVPIGYNVPMHEVADIWRLPREGDVLRVPYGDEAAEATALDKDTIYDLQSSLGSDDLTVPYQEFTIAEKGLFTQVNKWAKFTTALEVAKLIGNRLANSAARTMNSDAYTALVHQKGLQAIRVDGLDETNVELAFTINSATGLATTGCRTDLTDIDDWWNNGQVVFTTGANRGMARKITDFANTNGVLTFDAFPQAPANGDAGFVMVNGNGTASGPSDLASTDVLTLKALYRGRERCLRFGAGGLGMGGAQMDVVGVTRKRDGAINQGVCFIPTQLVYELQQGLAGNTAAQDQAFWQTSEGFRRAVGGTVLNVGGLMVVPVNHFKRMAISDGALSSTAGACYPSVILYPGAFGCSLLKDNPGNRQGMDITVKAPKKSDIAIMYDSLRYRGELDIINVYFTANALHGCTVWSGTSLV